MSHTSSIKSVKVTKIEAIRAAIEELAANGKQIRLEEGGTPRAYYSNQQGMGPADYVIRLPNAQYDIGLYRQQDGSFDLRTDLFGGSVHRELGASHTGAGVSREQAAIGQFFQMYNLHLASQTAKAKGWTSRRVTGKDGAIKLEIEVR